LLQGGGFSVEALQIGPVDLHRLNAPIVAGVGVPGKHLVCFSRAVPLCTGVHRAARTLADSNDDDLLIVIRVSRLEGAVVH